MAQKQSSDKTDAPVESEGVVAQDPTPPTGENRSNLPGNNLPPGDLRRRGRKEKRKGPFVKYVGTAAVRRITEPQWKSLAIKLHEDAVEHSWTVANDKMVEVSKFSDDQLDYLLIDDMQQGVGTHAFLLVDYDNDGQLVQVAYE